MFCQLCLQTYHLLKQMLDEALPSLMLVYQACLYNKYHLMKFHDHFERYHQQHNLLQVQQNFHYYYNIEFFILIKKKTLLIKYN